MVAEIADRSKHQANKAAIAKIVTAAVSAASGYALGSKVLSWARIAVFPCAGVPTAMAANAALNGLFTLKLGMATAKQFDRPDFDLLDVMNVAVIIAGGALTPIPSADELALIKSLLKILASVRTQPNSLMIRFS
jgi:hypothetical protein